MSDEAVRNCLEQLAQLPAGGHGVEGSSNEAGSYPYPWLLLDLLSLLPASSRLKQQLRKSPAQLSELLAAAAADEQTALQTAASLFIELGSAGDAANRQQLAEYLCINTDACQLLINCVNYAHRQPAGGRNSSPAQQLSRPVQPEVLLHAEGSIACSLFEQVARQYGRPGAVANEGPAAVVTALVAGTAIALQPSQIHPERGAEAAMATVRQHGSTVLDIARSLENDAGRLSVQEKVVLSNTVQQWALQAARVLCLNPYPSCGSYYGSGFGSNTGSSAGCRKLVDYFLSTATTRLTSKGSLKDGWFTEQGPLLGLAEIVCCMSKGVDSSRYEARELTKEHTRGLMELLLRCLHLGVQQQEPADGANSAAGGAAAASGTPQCWTGLPRDRNQAARILLGYVHAALQLSIVMERRGLCHVPPAQVLDLREALATVADSSGVSWLPPGRCQQLRRICVNALGQLESLFAYCADKVQLASRQASPPRATAQLKGSGWHLAGQSQLAVTASATPRGDSSPGPSPPTPPQNPWQQPWQPGPYQRRPLQDEPTRTRIHMHQSQAPCGSRRSDAEPPAAGPVAQREPSYADVASSQTSGRRAAAGSGIVTLPGRVSARDRVEAGYQSASLGADGDTACTPTAGTQEGSSENFLVKCWTKCWRFVRGT